MFPWLTNVKELHFSSSYTLNHSDHPKVILVSKPLNGKNFSTWHRVMIIFLNAKSILNLVDRTLKAPSAGDN